MEKEQEKNAILEPSASQSAIAVDQAVVAPQSRSQEIPSPEDPKASKKRKNHSLRTFLLLTFIVLICIILLIMYISMGTDIGASGSAQNEKGYVAKVLPNAIPLAAQLAQKPIMIEQLCYGLTIPYGIQKSSQRGQCSIFISLRDPKGSITVDYRIKESDDVLPDIIMRRSLPDKYEESIMIENNISYLVFKNLETQGYEKTVFLEKDTSWVAITLKTDIFKDRDTDMKDILRSFYCKNGCTVE